MKVTIDDAGWGCPVGGVLIAGLYEEAGTFASAVIGIEHFQPPKFGARTYLDEAAKCTETVLTSLGVLGNPSLHVDICSGFVHKQTHAWLAKSGIEFAIVKVQGPLQAKIESALLTYLQGLGFPYKDSTEEYGKLFYQAIRWLKGGDANVTGMAQARMQFAKTGWNSFRFYCNYPYQIAKVKAEAAKRENRLAKERMRDWNRDYATAEEE